MHIIPNEFCIIFVKISSIRSFVSKIRSSNAFDKSILNIPITDFASTTYLPEAKSKYPLNNDRKAEMPYGFLFYRKVLRQKDVD